MSGWILHRHRGDLSRRQPAPSRADRFRRGVREGGCVPLVSPWDRARNNTTVRVNRGGTPVFGPGRIQGEEGVRAGLIRRLGHRQGDRRVPLDPVAGLAGPLSALTVLENGAERVAVPESPRVHVRPRVVSRLVGRPVPLAVLLGPRVVIDRHDPRARDLCSVGLPHLYDYFTAHVRWTGLVDYQRLLPD